MDKRLVARFPLGSPAPVGYPLEPAADAAITAVWMNRASAAQRELATKVLDSARQDNRWIVCNCRPDAPRTDLPVLMLRQGESTIHLFRPEKRPEHSDTCPFRITTEEHELRSRRQQERSPSEPTGLIDPNDTPSFLDAETQPVATGPNPSSRERRSSSTRQDPLFKRLAWIVERSEINVRVAGDLVSVRSQWDQIIGLTKRTAISEGLTLDDIIIRGASWLSGDYRRAFNAISRKLPRDRRPVVYLLFVADALGRAGDGTTRVSASYVDRTPAQGKGARRDVNLTLPCEIRYPAADNDSAKAPFLVLLKIVSDTNGIPRLSRGVAQPIYERTNLYPVDSDQERKTFRKLLKIGGVRATKGGILVIEKPVQGRHTSKGMCRPDFILRTEEGRSMIVETMGYSDEEYRQRKSQTSEVMRLLGDTLFEDDRSGSKSDSDADEELYRAVMRWALRTSA